MTGKRNISDVEKVAKAIMEEHGQPDEVIRQFASLFNNVIAANYTVNDIHKMIQSMKVASDSPDSDGV